MPDPKAGSVVLRRREAASKDVPEGTAFDSSWSTPFAGLRAGFRGLLPSAKAQDEAVLSPREPLGRATRTRLRAGNASIWNFRSGRREGLAERRRLTEKQAHKDIRKGLAFPQRRASMPWQAALMRSYRGRSRPRQGVAGAAH